MPLTAIGSSRIGPRILVIALGVYALGVTVAIRASDDPAGSGKAAVPAERVASQPFLASYTRPASTPFPEDNAFTPAREALGRALFFDPRLSGSGWISCASCHNPGLSWGDGLPRAIGHGMQTLGRRTPTILNLAWGQAFFWDGRADTLEAQALGPIAVGGRDEPRPADDDRAHRRHRGLPDAVRQGLPGRGRSRRRRWPRRSPPSSAASSRRTRRSIAGSPATRRRSAPRPSAASWCSTTKAALRQVPQRLALHRRQLPRHRRQRRRRRPRRPARGDRRAAARLQDADAARRRTARGPYMHDGSVATLEAVVDFYDRGGAAAPREPVERRQAARAHRRREAPAAGLHAHADEPRAAGSRCRRCRADALIEICTQAASRRRSPSMFRTALRSSLVLAAGLAVTTVWLQAASHLVTQKGKVFAPGAVTVKVGDTSASRTTTTSRTTRSRRRRATSSTPRRRRRAAPPRSSSRPGARWR